MAKSSGRALDFFFHTISGSEGASSKVLFDLYVFAGSRTASILVSPVPSVLTERSCNLPDNLTA